MGTEAHDIINLAVAGHLRKTKLPRPVLGGSYQSSAESLATELWFDIPTLNIANARARAPFGVVAHTRLQRSAQARPATINREGSQVRPWLRAELCNLALMVVRRRWPEQVPQPQPFRVIAGNDTSDSHTMTHLRCLTTGLCRHSPL